MTRRELLNLPYEEFGKEIPLLDELYVIPTRKKHDSGYMCMEIIGMNKEGYAKKLATYSDVIHFPSIMNRVNKGHLKIDIPSDTKCFRFFSWGKIKVITYGISDFEFDIVEDIKQ